MDSGLDTFSVTLKNTNSATATINRSSTDTIDGATSLTLGMNESVTLQTNTAGDGWLKKQDKQTMYAGRLPAALIGGATLPAGWIADNPNTGTYLITHSLGLASSQYAVVVTIASSTTAIAKVTSIGPNNFNIVTEQTDGTNVDFGSSFIMMLP